MSIMDACTCNAFDAVAASPLTPVALERGLLDDAEFGEERLAALSLGWLSSAGENEALGGGDTALLSLSESGDVKSDLDLDSPLSMWCKCLSWIHLRARLNAQQNAQVPGAMHRPRSELTPTHDVIQALIERAACTIFHPETVTSASADYAIVTNPSIPPARLGLFTQLEREDEVSNRRQWHTKE